MKLINKEFLARNGIRKKKHLDCFEKQYPDGIAIDESDVPRFIERLKRAGVDVYWFSVQVQTKEERTEKERIYNVTEKELEALWSMYAKESEGIEDKQERRGELIDWATAVCVEIWDIRSQLDGELREKVVGRWLKESE